jgi:hypothetical protein
MGETKETVKNKRLRNKKAEDPSQSGKKRARQEDENIPADADQDEPQTKKKKVERDVEGEPTKIRNKREKGQAGQTDVKPSEKKRKRQDQEDQDEEANAIKLLTKKRRVEFVNSAKIEDSIRGVFKKVGKKLKFEYKAGAQAATTTLSIQDDSSKVKKKNAVNKTVVKTTAKNMHAEMEVLEEALDKSFLTITKEGDIAVQEETTSRRLKSGEFKTRNPKDDTEKMDHCGYCTFFLTLMDVPTELPTFQPSKFTGSQKGVSGLTYPLPDPIRKHPAIIAKALGIKSDSKRLSDASEFVNRAKEGIEGYYYEEKKVSRLRDRSSQEDIFSHLRIKDFIKWRDDDKADTGAEERFKTLLKDVFINRADEFVDSLWNPVITELTKVMKRDKKKREAFLKTTK